jgi:hypothetical protein
LTQPYFEERKVSQRARSAGLPAGMLLWNYNTLGRKEKDVMIADDGLPLRWRGGSALDSYQVVGPPEGVGIHGQ